MLYGLCDLPSRSPVEPFPENFRKLQRCVLGVWSGNPAPSLACLAERVSCLLATLPESWAGRSLKLQVIVVMMLVFLIDGGANNVMLDLWETLDFSCLV